MNNGRRMQKTIQTARHKLGLDDETYRDFLEGITGERSTKGMSAQNLWKVVQRLEKSGFEMEQPQGDMSKADDPQSTLIRHLWLTLKHYGELRNASERSLAQYVKRITKVEHLKWLKAKQAQIVIETLKKWVTRIEDKILEEAVKNGRLCLFGRFTDYGTFISESRAGRLNDAEYEEAAKVMDAVDAYLANYKPEAKPVKSRGAAV